MDVAGSFPCGALDGVDCFAWVGELACSFSLPYCAKTSSGMNGANLSHWASVRSDGYGFRLSCAVISADPFCSLESLLSFFYRLVSQFRHTLISDNTVI